MRRTHPISEQTPEIHKKFNPEKYEQTRKILKKNTEFRWNKKPKTFGGFDAKSLKELVATTGELIGIKPEQASKIRVIFGDQVHVDLPEGGTFINHAYCGTVYNDSGEAEKCFVVVNRSHELALAESTTNTGEDNDDKVSCRFEHPWENVVWLVAEELKHAHINLVARNESKIESWQENYKDVLQKKGKKITTEYSSDLEEVTASRVALKVLEKLASKDYPERATYFRKLYQMSLEKSTNVTPNISNVVDDVYVITGYSATTA